MRRKRNSMNKEAMMSMPHLQDIRKDMDRMLDRDDIPDDPSGDDVRKMIHAAASLGVPFTRREMEAAIQDVEEG